MYELFLQHFNSKVALTAEEEALLKTHLTPKKLRRKQYLLQSGDICKAFAFIEKGAMKSYTVDDAGVEHIIQFGIEGWIIADLYSFLTGEPAMYNVDVVEDAELVLISKSAHDALLKVLPSLEERYEQFKAQYPEFVQRFPQHMIASYMGLTPETLSRIRKRISAK